MALHLADILREHWPGFALAHAAHLCAAHHRAVRAVLACRTPQLGGHAYRCGQCHQRHYTYHDCNHRSCPRCGAWERKLWTARQEARLLPVPYFMVTFTLPSELRGLCRAHPGELYDLILKESALALRDIFATKHDGARAGFISVLHTWGRQMQHHPHVHTIVPALGYDAENDRLIRPGKAAFLVHYLPLAARFRSRLHTALKQKHPELWEKLDQTQRHCFDNSTQWNVNLKHVGRGATALRYLAAYVNRSAFAENRLLGRQPNGNILLRWKCSDNGQEGALSLSPHEFIRRWLLHVLPKGFSRIRHNGWLGSAAGKTRYRIRRLLKAGPEPKADLPERKAPRCEACGGALQFVGRVLRAPSVRGPPRLPLATSP